MIDHTSTHGVGSPIPRMGTPAGQDESERELSIAIGRLKAAHAKDGLEISRIITVLKNALAEEERLLASAQIDARSYHP